MVNTRKTQVDRSPAGPSTSGRRRRGRSIIGLTLAGALMIPSGLALADQVDKQTPPPPAVTKTAPPEPDLSAGQSDALPETNSLAQGEGALDDELSATESQAATDLEANSADQPAPGSKPSRSRFAEQTAGEPKSNSAHAIKPAGSSLSTLNPKGEELPKVDAEAVDPDGKTDAVASGDIALKGEAGAAKADWVIVGLSAPLDMSKTPVVVVGASWDALPAGVDVSAEIREHIDGKWSDWQGLDVENDAAPASERSSRQATEPYVSTAASDLQVRLLTSTGATPANARVELVSDSVTAADKKAATGGATASASATQVASALAADQGGAADAAISPAVATRSLAGDGVVSADTGMSVQTVAAVSQPAIRARSAWGAKAPKSSWEYGAVRGMVIHHTAGSNNYSASQVPMILRSIQQYHMDTNKWNDIGYNFLIDKFGVIWEGRAGGIANAIVGAQAKNVNSSTSGVSVLGTYSTVAAPAATTSALSRLIAWKLSLTSVNPKGTMVNLGKTTPTIIGHRDAPGNSTACPGNRLYAQIPGIRSAVAASTVPSFTLRGSGSGTGVGLSQYGAYGLAQQGWSGIGIAQHYFAPARVINSASNPTLKVQLVKRSSVVVGRSAGTMQVVVGKKAYKASKVTFKIKSGKLVVVIGKKTYRAPKGGFQVRWSGTRYMKGKAGVVYVRNAAAGKGTVRYRYGRMLVTKIGSQVNVVNQLKLNNEYLYGVAVVPSSWPNAAMRAQAIASRTLALKAYTSRGGRTISSCNCQLTDEASNQTYRGWSHGGQAKWGVKWRAAVNGTDVNSGSYIRSGQVLYSGGLIDIKWTPSTGGATTSNQEAVGRGIAYLSTRSDPAVGNGANPYRAWGKSISSTQLARLFGLPDVQKLEVARKGASGAVMVLQATAADGRVAQFGGSTEAIRTKLGVPSAYFSVG